MIRVPPQWPCARFPCALVELNGIFSLCQVRPCAQALMWYTIETVVGIPPEEAARLLAQDCALAESRAVHIRPSQSGVEYCERKSGDDTTTGEMLVIHCPLYSYTAKEVVLAGPRRDTRATPSHLLASLVGKYVMVGCQLRLGNDGYKVAQLTLHSGYRGATLVGPDCRVKINSHSGRKEAPLCPHEIVGMEEEQTHLLTLLGSCRTVRGTAVGCIVRGPRGCGASMLASHTTQCGSAKGESVTMEWSPAFSALLAREKAMNCAVVALLIKPLEHYFSESDVENAKQAMRKLNHDVRILTAAQNGTQLSALVIGITHNYSLCSSSVLNSLFTFHVVCNLPEVKLRAGLLARVRGGDPASWADEAHTMTGLSSREVLDVAARHQAHTLLPFHPVRWDDIGGLEEVKTRLHRALVWPQQQPEVFARFRLKPPRGILLYGPPGCAKTTLVKALCSEGGFYLIYLDSATVVSAYVGESERYLRDVFARARQHAPCIVFFDEVEVLGGRRVSGDRNDEQVRLLSTLLTEMDGFAETLGVCFVGATNVPQLLDSALLRPGRFDYVVHVPLPSLKDREGILALLLQHTAADAAVVAAATEGFSGADLKSLCTECLLTAIGDCKEPPAHLRDAAGMTAFLVSAASSMKRTNYDAEGLEIFHRTVAAA